MGYCLQLRYVILLSSVVHGLVFGTVFNQFDYKMVDHVRESSQSGLVFELAPETSSVLDCAVTCATLGCLTFSFESETKSCRTSEEIADDNTTKNISSSVTYFTREVCRSVPSYYLATPSNTSDMVILAPNGTSLYPLGTQVQFTCGKSHYFLGGNVTCSSSGQWTGESTPTGCSGQCFSDSDCVTVPSSICDNGLCKCPNGSSLNSEHQACITDCLSLYEAGLRTDGVYEIKPDGLSTVQVYCDMSNGGWTVFQNRVNGDVEFHRANWLEMETGLGSPMGDHWLGLTYIHMLTWTDNLIHFELVLLDDSNIYFQYTNFRVDNSSTKYQMSVAEVYLSNAYSHVNYAGFYAHNSMMFTTTDSDNDPYIYNCANSYGPWWFSQCGVFGAFNNDFSAMSFWNVPGVGRAFVKQTQVKIRRQ